MDRQMGSKPVAYSRNYGIDALRIVSMLMVVTLHVLGHGGILNSSKSTNYWIAWYLEIAAYCAVNCYALISGYVGVFSKYKISNLAILWCRVAFYTIAVTVLFKCFFPANIGKVDLIASFFPVASKQYWYFSAYAFMFLFIPILNEALNRLSKKKTGAILITVVIATCAVRPFAVHYWGDGFGLSNGYSALWLMILYLIGGYIRKYGLFTKIKSHRTVVFLLLYLAVISATWFAKFATQIIDKKVLGKITVEGIMINYTTITILAEAVFLLLAFEHLRFHSAWIKFISFLSPLAFSVYLIHEQTQIRENYIVGRFIWAAKLPAYQMILIVFGFVAGIFILCSAIDLIRHYLFKAVRLKERLDYLEIKIKERIAGKAV